MATDQSAKFTPLIQKVFDHAQAFSTRNGMPCATFQVTGTVRL